MLYYTQNFALVATCCKQPCQPVLHVVFTQIGGHLTNTVWGHLNLPHCISLAVFNCRLLL